MSGIQELITITKEMGLEGEAIQKFVEKATGDGKAGKGGEKR